MAADADLSELRQNIAEEDDSTWSDEYLKALIDTSGSVAAASVAIWTKKAASYAELVNVSEAGSSRSLSDLYKQALAMAKQFQGQVDLATGVTETSHRAKTHKIVRS